jgi:hypothetical protein
VIRKQILVPDRVRTVPAGFGWVDRRVIREGHFDALDSSAILLYYFLTTVADAQGLSYWADPTVGRILKLSPSHVVGARDRLVRSGLIAYRHPLYQVLALPAATTAALSTPPAAPRAARPTPERPGRGRTLTGWALFGECLSDLRPDGEEVQA